MSISKKSPKYSYSCLFPHSKSKLAQYSEPKCGFNWENTTNLSLLIIIAGKNDKESNRKKIKKK